MTDSKHSLRGSSLSSLPTGAQAAPMVPKPRQVKEEQPAKQTVFIPRPVHKRLKEICFERNISQQQIFMAALDAWLVGEGEPPIDKLISSHREIYRD